MIVGGRRFSYSPEDYVLATINIFLDIIYIFIYLLQIIGSSRSWAEESIFIFGFYSKIKNAD